MKVEEMLSKKFSEEDIKGMQPAMKIGLLATINPQGLPHITLITTLMACSPTQMCFGQFIEGISKKYIQGNPKAGFMVMGLDKNLWRGKITFTHTAKNGREFDYYNNVPMFRYNAYFGIHTVYYLDLVAHTGRSPLPMNSTIVAAMATRIGRTRARQTGGIEVMNTWTCAFINKLDNLKFLAYVGEDGYPTIIPAIQTQCLNPSQLLFSTLVYKQELEAIPTGACLAVFGMALSMEDVLVRGKYQGLRHFRGVQAGVVTVDWVYNSMPPVPGQIYPPVEIKQVTEF